MISPKLLVLLQGFSKFEMKTFYKFIQSPFHNENLDLVRLFEVIDHEFQQSGWDINKNNSLSKDIVWEKIRGNETYHDEQMRRMCSDLLKKIYSFFAYQQFKKNPLDEIIHLLPTINTPRLNKHFAGAIRQAQMIQEKSKLKKLRFSFFKI